MKICHCIKMSTDEKVALEMVDRMLHQLAEDEVLARDFNAGSSLRIDEITAWFDDVYEYLKRWGE